MIISYLFLWGLSAQEPMMFTMEHQKHLFAKPVQFKFFYENKSNVINDQKQRAMLLLKERFSGSDIDAKDLEKIYYELHIKPRCHKLLKLLHQDTYDYEKRASSSINNFTDMAAWSGQSFVHVANIDLKTMMLTEEQYDVDIAIVLQKPGSAEYIYYLPKCADTPLPFIYLNSNQ